MRWPNNFSCYLPVFAADLVDNEDSPAFAAGFSDDGKLGYGFTSADDLEEVDIGPGDKPRPTFISKKLDPVLHEEMIALLKEYWDCFAWDYHQDARSRQKHHRASAPAQERVSAISATSTSDEGRSPRRSQERSGEDVGCWVHQAVPVCRMVF